MKKSELLFNLISIPMDFLMILVAGVVAFELRFRLAGLRPIIYTLSLPEYLKVLILIAPALVILMALA